MTEPGEQTPAPQIGYATPFVAPRTNAFAIVSLVCGCILCIPFLPGIFATIFGILGIRQTRKPNTGGKGLAIAGLILGVVNLLAWTAYFALVIAFMVPALNNARVAVNQAVCANNMQAVGQAIMLYAQQHRGDLPPDLATLMQQANLSGQTLVCPLTNSTAPTTQQAATAKLDYIYVGQGRNTNNIDPKTILIYERLTNHAGQGINVLRADGSVEFVTGPEAYEITRTTTQPSQ
jgi:prepilin-type processing-associated H-X9-DG protein